MQKFRIDPDRYKEITQKLLLTRAVVMTVMIIIAGVIANSSNKTGDDGTENSILFWIIFISVIAVMNGIGWYRDSKKQKATLESYTLLVADNLIVREQLNTPSIYLYFNDIKEIVSQRNGGLIIRSKDASDIITLPPQVENFYELENILNNIHPISASSAANSLQKYRNLLSLLGLAAMVCVYTLNNKIIVGISGTLFIILMTWSFYEIRRSKNVNRKTKQGAWWILLVLASVTYVMIAKLMS